VVHEHPIILNLYFDSIISFMGLSYGILTLNEFDMPLVSISMVATNAF
jgi:hypothetical protein